MFGNNFFSLALSPNYYKGTSGSGLGGGANISYGKWLITTAGLRGNLSLQMASSPESQLYAYGSFDVFFDLLSSIKGRNTSDIFRSYCFAGFGLVHCFDGDNDFLGSFGLGADFKISDNWRLLTELNLFVQPYDFDGNTKSSFLGMLKLGATRDINYNPTRSRSRYETRGFYNDWFFHVALGTKTLNYRSEGSFADHLHDAMPAFGFGFGKRLTSAWTIRLVAEGLYAKCEDDIFTFYSVSGDLMLNTTGLLMPERGHTAFNVLPYLGDCFLSRLDSPGKFLFAINAGAVFSYRPDKRNEIFLDAHYQLCPSRFVTTSQPQGSYSVGVASLMLGYSYIFSMSSFR